MFNSEIIFNHALKQFVSVKLADKTARIVVCGDISRVFGENITNNLADRVVSILVECVIDFKKNLLHFFIVFVLDGELNSFVGHN